MGTILAVIWILTAVYIFAVSAAIPDYQYEMKAAQMIVSITIAAAVSFVVLATYTVINIF